MGNSRGREGRQPRGPLWEGPAGSSCCPLHLRPLGGSANGPSVNSPFPPSVTDPCCCWGTSFPQLRPVPHMSQEDALSEGHCFCWRLLSSEVWHTEGPAQQAVAQTGRILHCLWSVGYMGRLLHSYTRPGLLLGSIFQVRKLRRNG